MGKYLQEEEEEEATTVISPQVRPPCGDDFFKLAYAGKRGARDARGFSAKKTEAALLVIPSPFYCRPVAILSRKKF